MFSIKHALKLKYQLVRQKVNSKLCAKTDTDIHLVIINYNHSAHFYVRPYDKQITHELSHLFLYLIT